MTPRIRLAEARDPAPGDLLVIPVFEGDDLADLSAVDDACGGDLTRAVAAGELTGKAYELFFARAAGANGPRRIMCVGAGGREGLGIERIRRVATAACIAARQRRITRVALLVRGPDAAVAAGGMADGAVFANFEGGSYKTSEPPAPFLESVAIVSAPGGAVMEAAIERGRLLGESANIVRELSNEPGNSLTPSLFAERADQLARPAGLQVEVLDEQRLAQLGTGLLLGVARGSAEPPRMIVLRHDPHGAPATPVLALVGKGITFDTGGISIKTADGMDRMKDDMAGGAAVVAAMRAIAQSRVPLRVVGVIPATENMPGSRALKPGDVLRSASGKTVEVLNTDAEGRLILGDGLWYAQQLGATHLVDIATLTGACSVALGRAVSGLFGTPETWLALVRAAADRGGDRVWPMPLFDDYKEQLKSEIADFTNSGGRPAGAITAALFLKEFSGGLPWCHIDIAATAWNDEAKPYMPKGSTGVGVRTLVEVAAALATTPTR